MIKTYKMFIESLKSDKDLWNIIPDSVKELNDLFKQNGKKLYLVGGAVRDFLTGDKPKDFDLATDALPDEVLDILDGRYRTNLQGKAFGVVVVYTDDEPDGMEIATFREDVSKGRNPEVRLGVTIQDDVNRRDLTYNALFYDLETKEIVDLLGGVQDLKNKITKMVGNPIERFEEDSLRILRAFRFASRYGHPLHKDTEIAIKKRNQLQNIDPESGLVKRISQERIWEEMKKSWKQAKDYKTYLEFFNKYDMWDQVFPNSNINKELVDSKNFTVVIANLFKNEKLENIKSGYSMGKNLERKLIDYKLEGDLAKKVVFLISFLNFKPEYVYDFYKKKNQSGIDDSTILEWLSVNNIENEWMIKFINYKPSISAKDLAKKGFRGAELGLEIKRLEINKFKSL